MTPSDHDAASNRSSLGQPKVSLSDRPQSRSLHPCVRLQLRICCHSILSLPKIRLIGQTQLELPVFNSKRYPPCQETDVRREYHNETGQSATRCGATPAMQESSTRREDCRPDEAFDANGLVTIQWLLGRIFRSSKFHYRDTSNAPILERRKGTTSCRPHVSSSLRGSRPKYRTMPGA